MDFLASFMHLDWSRTMEGSMKALIVAVVTVLSIPQLLLGQSRPDSWDNLKELRPGQKIEVTDLGFTSVKGEFIAFSSDEISLRTDKSAVSILKANVRSVKNREKHHRVRSVVLGALLGAAGGAGAGAVIASSAADSSEVSYGAYIGFLVGAGGGAALGAARPSPVTIYEIREPAGHD
jgi:hypothetical protein